jgi:uncharacterized membrane protein (DUF2068 family)
MQPRLDSNTSAPRVRGLTLIIAFKQIKGVLWLIFAAVILVLMHFGLEGHVLGLARHLPHHAHAWSVLLGKLIARVADRRGSLLVVVALTVDGGVSLIESWALLHGSWWGPWLVVVTTASLLPFEAIAFVRHPHAVRAAMFCINAAIVWYLVQTARRHREHEVPRA